MKKVLGALRRAIDDYQMIQDGDRVAVGVSGGKDSLLLAKALNAYSKFSPEKFTVVGIHIDMGFKDTDKERFAEIEAFFKEEGMEFHVVKTDIAEIIFDIRKESNPCSLCSKMRRGALCTAANELNCNKIALGHHADDVLETMLLSLAFESRFSTFSPTSYLDRTKVTVIRPFVYLEEKYVVSAARRFDLPVLHNPCPADKHTERQHAKEFVGKLIQEIPDIKDHMLSALFHPERNNLWPLRPGDDEKDD